MELYGLKVENTSGVGKLDYLGYDSPLSSINLRIIRDEEINHIHYFRVGIYCLFTGWTHFDRAGLRSTTHAPGYHSYTDEDGNTDPSNRDGNTNSFTHSDSRVSKRWLRSSEFPRQGKPAHRGNNEQCEHPG
jgi:hypothetical protein